MINCDFCGKEMLNPEKTKREDILNEGNYCDECKNKDLDELYNEILEDDSECSVNE